MTHEQQIIEALTRTFLEEMPDMSGAQAKFAARIALAVVRKADDQEFKRVYAQEMGTTNAE